MPTAAGTITGIKADSRLVGPGDLFVALNTGVAHVADAAARGAATLVPDDQEAALAALASLVRSKSEARVVAVVGSTGKTSTKDILGALCSAATPTVWAEASQNNEIGLPLTVCRLEPDTAVLVTEMGMRGLGQIAALCEIARPDVASSRRSGPSTSSSSARSSASPRRTPRRSRRSPRAGSPSCRPMRPSSSRTSAAPTSRSAGSTAARSRAAATTGRSRSEAARSRSPCRSPPATWPRTRSRRSSPTTPSGFRSIGPRRAPTAIALSRWRGEELPLPGGGIVVNDAYNANPTSMRAALLDLVARAGDRRRVAILGEMAELGAERERYHEEIGVAPGRARDRARDRGRRGRRGRTSATRGPPGSVDWIPDAAAFDSVAGHLRPGDAILVKASRAVGLEGIPASIEKRARAWSES